MFGASSLIFRCLCDRAKQCNEVLMRLRACFPGKTSVDLLALLHTRRKWVPRSAWFLWFSLQEICKPKVVWMKQNKCLEPNTRDNDHRDWIDWLSRPQEMLQIQEIRFWQSTWDSKKETVLSFGPMHGAIFYFLIIDRWSSLTCSSRLQHEYLLVLLAKDFLGEFIN